MHGLQRQVRQKKSQIKGRVAEMADLKVDEPDLAGTHEQVFGAEVAVDEAEARAVGFVDEVIQGVREVRMDDCQAAVVGIEPERVKEGAVLQSNGDVRIPPTAGVQGSQQCSAGGCDLGVGFAGQQLFFPGPVGRWGGGHCVAVVGAVGEEDLRDRRCPIE